MLLLELEIFIENNFRCFEFAHSLSLKILLLTAAMILTFICQHFFVTDQMVELYIKLLDYENT